MATSEPTSDADELPPAFFLPCATGGYTSTPATAGPWSSGTQHGGPPSALLSAALATAGADLGLRLVKVTVELLRPVPVDRVTVSTEIVRNGSRQAIIDGRLFDDTGRVALLARARAVRTNPLGVPTVEHEPAIEPLPAPQAFRGMTGAHTAGYLSAMEWRFPGAQSSFDSLGPDSVWARQRIPLIGGVDDTPLTRALVVADSNWAAAFELDRHGNFIINVDLGVTFARWPAGEWIGLRSRTHAGADATAYAVGTIYDQAGPFGLVTQTLLLSPR